MPGLGLARREIGIFDPLPITEMLLDELGLDDDVGPGDRLRPGQPGRDDARRRHMRALQGAHHPDRIARQQLGKSGEGRLVAAIAGMIGLAIAAPVIDRDRRVADPPPARHVAHAAAASITRISAVCSSAPSTSPVWPPSCRCPTNATSAVPAAASTKAPTPAVRPSAMRATTAPTAAAPQATAASGRPAAAP